jgi:large conductance mechanosensitive channel
MDMAIGLIIGAAFGAIVSSLVDDVMMPPLGAVMGGLDFSDKVIVLREERTKLDAEGKAVMKDGKDEKLPAVKLSYGKFINAIIKFTVVAFCLFLVVKQLNRLRKQAPPPEPTTRPCPYCQSTISLKATRCPHCTSELPANAAA